MVLRRHQVFVEAIQRLDVNRMPHLRSAVAERHLLTVIRKLDAGHFNEVVARQATALIVEIANNPDKRLPKNFSQFRLNLPALRGSKILEVILPVRSVFSQAQKRMLLPLRMQQAKDRGRLHKLIDSVVDERVKSLKVDSQKKSFLKRSLSLNIKNWVQQWFSAVNTCPSQDVVLRFAETFSGFFLNNATLSAQQTMKFVQTFEQSERSLRSRVRDMVFLRARLRKQTASRRVAPKS